ncbi:MAG: hypothetical protein O2975_05565 [Proteobacteria bacterium]|nr:hypothetical protein [Pseudomonadota bacterium]
MSDEQAEKTPFDKLNGVDSQLKEMAHCARSNLETLSAISQASNIGTRGATAQSIS